MSNDGEKIVRYGAAIGSSMLVLSIFGEALIAPKIYNKTYNATGEYRNFKREYKKIKQSEYTVPLDASRHSHPVTKHKNGEITHDQFRNLMKDADDKIKAARLKVVNHKCHNFMSMTKFFRNAGSIIAAASFMYLYFVNNKENYGPTK